MLHRIFFMDKKECVIFLHISLAGSRDGSDFRKEEKKEDKREIEVRRKKVSKVLGKCRVENTQILDPSVFFAKPCVTRRILHKY